MSLDKFGITKEIIAIKPVVSEIKEADEEGFEIYEVVINEVFKPVDSLGYLENKILHHLVLIDRYFPLSLDNVYGYEEKGYSREDLEKAMEKLLVKYPKIQKLEEWNGHNENFYTLENDEKEKFIEKIQEKRKRWIKL